MAGTAVTVYSRGFVLALEDGAGERPIYRELANSAQTGLRALGVPGG